MEYTEKEVLDLIEDLKEIGASETTREQIHRYLREWQIEVGINDLSGKTPKEICDLQQKLGLEKSGILDRKTLQVLSEWSLLSFYDWMINRRRRVQIIEFLRFPADKTEYGVVFKEFVIDFRRRIVLPGSPEELKKANLLYWKFLDYIPVL